MTLQKFRSAEEMQETPPRRVAEDAVARFLRHCARYRRMSPSSYPRGVFKFRTVEEAEAARERVASR